MNVFIVVVWATDDVLIHSETQELANAFLLFKQALCQNKRAKLFGFSGNKKPLLICDTEFYKPKQRMEG